MSQATCESAEAVRLHLCEVFSPGLVVYFEPGISKEDSIRQLVLTLAEHGKLPVRAVEEVIADVLRREMLGTTAMGRGMAFPHARTSVVDRSRGIVGVSTAGIEFGALDGMPTRLLFLLLSPAESRIGHLQILGRLAKLLGDRTIQYTVQIPRTPEQLTEFLGLSSPWQEVDDSV